MSDNCPNKNNLEQISINFVDSLFKEYNINSSFSNSRKKPIKNKTRDLKQKTKIFIQSHSKDKIIPRNITQQYQIQERKKLISNLITIIQAITLVKKQQNLMFQIISQKRPDK